MSKIKLDKYAIYLRKSRADLEAEKFGEGETLARHKQILTDMAARQGLYVDRIYQELESGDTIADRPMMQEMINDCYAGKYKGIIIIEVTRLSRGNQGDAQKIMDCLKYGNRNNGVLVVTPTKTYDVAHNSDDEEYMEFELFMSRREFKMIKKRMQRGKLQAVVEGNYMGSSRPYGYDIVKTKRSRTLVPNEFEAPIVKQIYQWIVQEGMTPYAIARRLTGMGVPTYNKEIEWSRRTIHDMITNPVYMGKIRWNDRMRVKAMVDGELKTVRSRTNDNDKLMIFDGKHKKHALVDEETFEMVRNRFEFPRNRQEYKLKNPLASIFCCSKCGKTMTYQSYSHRKTNTAPRYVHREGTQCKVKSVMASDVINATIHGLKMYLEDFEMKVEGLAPKNEISVTEQLEALRKEIRKIQNIKDMLFDAWENKDITGNEFAERKAVHNERIENIEAQIEKLESEIPEREEIEDKIVKLHEALDALFDDNADAKNKNDYIKRIVDKIDFTRENDKEFILDITLR